MEKMSHTFWPMQDFPEFLNTSVVLLGHTISFTLDVLSIGVLFFLLFLLLKVLNVTSCGISGEELNCQIHKMFHTLIEGSFMSPSHTCFVLIIDVR